MAAAAQISSSLDCNSSARGTSALSAAKTASSARFPRKFGTTFRNHFTGETARTLENQFQSDVTRRKQTGISVEIATGKGLLENFGVATPLPTLALGVTVLVGVLTAVFIFQSASES